MSQFFDWIGYAAAFCTTAAFIPQALQTIRTRDTRSLSLGMYALFTLGLSLWLLYGVYKRDFALIAANAVTVVLALVILCSKLRNDGIPGWPARRGRPFSRT